ncbi:hypothetical protein B0T17DRAFT_512261 [Bombardia bombarda]|uniref:Uncharacterized protein n=1 Tax=Bombardia bombarda TaxID=252184 RepID=A0AA39U2V0_9PEZI|nr:hypothetical protein B0T17DRAFT_512261 [Bombardia bombarda]
MADQPPAQHNGTLLPPCSRRDGDAQSAFEAEIKITRQRQGKWEADIKMTMEGQEQMMGAPIDIWMGAAPKQMEGIMDNNNNPAEVEKELRKVQQPWRRPRQTRHILFSEAMITPATNIATTTLMVGLFLLVNHRGDGGWILIQDGVFELSWGVELILVAMTLAWTVLMMVSIELVVMVWRPVIEDGLGYFCV